MLSVEFDFEFGFEFGCVCALTSSNFESFDNCLIGVVGADSND